MLYNLPCLERLNITDHLANGQLLHLQQEDHLAMLLHTPHQTYLVCSAAVNYDPNTETGALFVCEGRDQDEYKKAGGWTIKNTDKCELFCSEGKQLLNLYPSLINISLAPEPVVSVFCDRATWKGQPDLGFWCYDKPENPGPQKGMII